jgi:secernin
MKTTLKIIIITLLLIIALFNLAMDMLACDTWVALANATALKMTLFAKNSDRLLFDSQPLMLHPRAKWPAGAGLDLGRIAIPQVRETYATLGSSPYWCWGYEEGINEFGVAIGNEGVSTKPLLENVAAALAGKEPAPGLTGMDLVRLGLERGRTAREALKVIADFLERFGQFGSGNPTQGVEGAYDNSFLIADPKEAWVLETAGRHWAARRFVAGTTSISNKLSLGTDWSLSSRGLTEYARTKSWWPREKTGPLDFTIAFIDDTPEGAEKNTRALVRQTCSAGLLQEMTRRVTIDGMMRIARDQSTMPSLDLDQTASSCVAALPSTTDDLPVFWWCAATPSRSCYIPFFVHGSRLPDILSAAGTLGRTITAPEKAGKDEFSESSFWWLFRDLCDKINADSASRKPEVRTAFDALEKEFAAGIPEVVKQAVAFRKSGRAEEAAQILDAYSEKCVARTLEKAREFRAKFAQSVSQAIPEKVRPYIGSYTAPSGALQGREYKVFFRNGRLAIDIPGQIVAELRDPDARGRWVFVLTKDIAISFDLGPDGTAAALIFHQATAVAKAPAPKNGLKADAQAEVLPYLGKYVLPAARLELAIVIRSRKLVLEIPGQGAFELETPDEDGLWRFSGDPGSAVSFVRDPEGKVSALKVHRTIRIPRKNMP